MNYRTAHRSGTSKIQNRSSTATTGKNASHPRRTGRLFRLVGCVLFALAGLGGLALAMQQSVTMLEQAQNAALYPNYHDNVWAILQVHGR